MKLNERANWALPKDFQITEKIEVNNDEHIIAY